MVSTAGYSGKPLVEKLGIKPGMQLTVVDPPRSYRTLVGKLPPGASIETMNGRATPRLFIHWFAKERRVLEQEFATVAKQLAPAGALWVSWPKRGSDVETDLTENVVREIGLDGGLVDVKVCAVDETWSALKFVRRVKDR